jgi:hypothetical protein
MCRRDLWSRFVSASVGYGRAKKSLLSLNLSVRKQSPGSFFFTHFDPPAI